MPKLATPHRVAVVQHPPVTLHVAGHYGRPDLFRLEVKREALTPVEFG